jgi:hypothetical protein
MTYTISDFRRDIRQPYAWPGGYPRYFIMSDGGAISFEGARANRRLILAAIADQDRSGWCVVGCDINYEDPDLICDATGKRIESAYHTEGDEQMDKEQPQSVAAHLTNMLARIPAAQADEQAEHAKDEDTAFFADEVDLAEAELFCDGASGIYIPQRFAQEVKRSRLSLGVAHTRSRTRARGLLDGMGASAGQCSPNAPDPRRVPSLSGRRPVGGALQGRGGRMSPRDLGEPTELIAWLGGLLVAFGAVLGMILDQHRVDDAARKNQIKRFSNKKGFWL